MFVYEHPSSTTHIEVETQKGIYKLAEAERARATKAGEPIPAWARSPGECKLVKQYDPETKPAAPTYSAEELDARVAAAVAKALAAQKAS